MESNTKFLKRAFKKEKKTEKAEEKKLRRDPVILLLSINTDQKFIKK